VPGPLGGRKLRWALGSGLSTTTLLSAVTPASRWLSRGHLARGIGGGTPPLQPPGRRRYAGASIVQGAGSRWCRSRWCLAPWVGASCGGSGTCTSFVHFGAVGGPRTELRRKGGEVSDEREKSVGKVVEGDEAAFADVLPGLGDSAEGPLVVFEPVVEPVVLIVEPDHQGGRPAVAGDEGGVFLGFADGCEPRPPVPALG